MRDVAENKGLRPAPVTMLVGYAPHVLCPYCGKQIHFVRTVKGGRMPCEPELVEGDGVKTLVTNGGVTVRRAPAGVWGYEPHWGFCRFGRKGNKSQKED